MPQPQIVPAADAVEAVSCDAVVLGAFAGDDGAELAPGGAPLDRELDGSLTEHLRNSWFKAKVGDVAVVPTLGRLPAKTVVVAGLGRADDAGPTEVRRAAGVAARRLSEHSVIASALHGSLAEHDAASASVEGFLLGSYRFTAYKTDPRPSKIQRILLLDRPSDETVERGRALAEATTLARDLTNEPSSALTPELLATRAREVADVAGLECTIVKEEELERRGFGGILGVSRGSSHAPRLIQLRHAPSGALGKVFLVGKGITFDSGGLSLKDAKNMETMKTDMAGSAAVIGAMSALPRLDVGVEVVALVPASENMPGGNALKPGDVITHYGGRTSEVLNTDAEGRLVLADAVALASEQRPDAIVDVATLTGAMMVALGGKATGFFATHDALARELEAAAARAGERFWRMPLYEEYRPELDSEVADIKNSGPRWGAAIFGALFIKDFLGKGIPWAHLDIAGPSRAEFDYEEIPKGGSGVATRTLISWAEGRGR